MKGYPFSLTVDTAVLSAAGPKFTDLHDFLIRNGETLAALARDRAGWTGAAATACLDETGRISSSLTAVALKIDQASRAVETFRTAVVRVQEEQLPSLNQRWEKAKIDCETEISDGLKGNEVVAFIMGPGVRADAFARRGATQYALTVEFDGLVTDLAQKASACGKALADSAPVTFTVEQWAQVKGGNIGRGLLASLRSQVFGDDTRASFVGQSDALKAASYVAGKLEDLAKNGQPGDKLDPDVVVMMAQMRRDAGFAQELLTKLGPGGAAFLSAQARSLYESRYKNGEKEQGEKLLWILTGLYATGSNVLVSTGDDPGRPLMDRAWLDNFNPESYDQLGEQFRHEFQKSSHVHGYRPDLLLPFMNRSDVFSSDFSQLVTQRALEDYENRKSLTDDRDAYYRWFQYSGGDENYFTAEEIRKAVIIGDTSNAFRTDLFHIALDRTAEHPLASNAMMSTHRDTMLGLMTGKDEAITGGQYRHDWASPALAEILKKATIGTQGGEIRDINRADAALLGVADYLKSHKDEHLVRNVQVALGAVVTDTRFMDGAISSVTSPFGEIPDGFQNDPGHPEKGPLMYKNLWARLHVEAMGQPETAAKIIFDVKQYMGLKAKAMEDHGNLWDRSLNNGKGGYVRDLAPSYLDLFQSSAARNFLGNNLRDANDVLKAELERVLEENGEERENAELILGTMTDIAIDPLVVPGVLKDFTVKEAVKWAIPTAGIEAGYKAQLKHRDAILGNAGVDLNPWTSIKAESDLAIKTMGTVSTRRIEAPQQDLKNPTGAPPKTYDADPRRYFEGFHPPMIAARPLFLRPVSRTDDFLSYNPAGVPVNVMETSQMNPAQRSAYMNWLHDPALQNRLEGVLGKIATGDVLAKAALAPPGK